MKPNKTKPKTDLEARRIANQTLKEMIGVRVWKFSSSDGRRTYTTLLWPGDGKLTCDCKGWTFRRSGQPRNCKHTQQVTFSLPSSQYEFKSDDEFIYAIRRDA